jgi:hypothetical protein
VDDGQPELRMSPGFFHLFAPAERETFAAALAACLAPGGRYYVLGFAIAPLSPNAPRQVREDELRVLFSEARGWRTLVLRKVDFKTRSTRGDIPAVAGCFERMRELQKNASGPVDG